MLIRPATIKDYEQLDEIYFQSDLFHYQNDNLRNAEPKKGARSKELLKTFIGQEESELFVSVIDERIVGLVHVYIRRKEGNNVFKPDIYVYVGDLGVHENYRRQGVGKKLMEKAEEWAREKDIHKMVLRADYFNKCAISLYEKVGYEVFSVEMQKMIEGVKNV